MLLIMNQFKSALESLKINTEYLNLCTLYEHCGDDIINVAKYETAKNKHELEKIIHEYGLQQLLDKYIDNHLILSIFRHGCRSRPHKIKFDRNKYENIPGTTLNLSNYEIFVSALKYFLDDDINFLNMNAVYDETEIYFSDLIDSLRNNTFDCAECYAITAASKKYSCLIINKNKPSHVTPFRNPYLLVFLNSWYYLMVSKLKSIDVCFHVGINHYYTDDTTQKILWF